MYPERVSATARKVKFRNEGYLGTGAIPKCYALHENVKLNRLSATEPIIYFIMGVSREYKRF